MSASVIKLVVCPECGDDGYSHAGVACENYEAHPLGDYPVTVERVYWLADEVLYALWKDSTWGEINIGRGESAVFLEQWFSEKAKV